MTELYCEENTMNEQRSENRRSRSLFSSLVKRSSEKASTKYFINKDAKVDVFNISKNLADYLYEEQIPNVAFLDRSARPAYVGMRNYWRSTYLNDKLPNIYFFSPKGFETPEELEVITNSGLSRRAESKITSLGRGEPIESFENVRSYEEIMDEVETTYKKLMQDKDKPLLLFDTCIHSGDSFALVASTLEEIGFSDVRLGVVADHHNESDIELDFVALSKIPQQICYPFSKSTTVEKTFSSVMGRRLTSHSDQQQINSVRREINKIMNENLAK